MRARWKAFFVFIALLFISIGLYLFQYQYGWVSGIVALLVVFSALTSLAGFSFRDLFKKEPIEREEKVPGERVTEAYRASSHVPREPDNIVSIVLGFSAFVTLLAYSVRTTPSYVHGEDLVTMQIGLMGIYVRPIALFMYLYFLSYVFGLNASISKRRLINLPPYAFEAMYSLAWLFAMISGFELIYQIIIWTAGRSIAGPNYSPLSSVYEINVYFVVALIVLVLTMSCYSINYLGRIRVARRKLSERAGSPDPSIRDI